MRSVALIRVHIGRDAASGWSSLALDAWVLNISLRVTFPVALFSGSLSVVNLVFQKFHCNCSLSSLKNLVRRWGLC